METLNLTLVQSFLAVYQNRSFHLAGKSLSLAQPTISQHIQKLEEQLHCQLFMRSRSACVPTMEAEALLPFAKSLMQLNGRALASVKALPLRIGASSNIGIYLLQPLLKTFLNQGGDTCVDVIIERNTQVVEKLESAEVDIALTEWWDDRPGFQARVWKRDPMVVIVPPEHPLAHTTSVDRDLLRSVPLLGGEPGTGTGRLLAQYFGDDISVPPPSLQLGSTEAVKQAVRSGVGISLVLQSTVENEVRQGLLVALPLQDPELQKDLWIIWRGGSASESKPLPAFVQHVLHHNTC